MALLKRNSVPAAWALGAPAMITAQERLREAIVTWFMRAYEAGQREDDASVAVATLAAGQLLNAYSSAIQIYNEWYDTLGDTTSIKYALSPRGLMSLGGKAMLSCLEVQMTAAAASFHPDPTFRAEAEKWVDTSWTSYTMVYGPVDEQAHGRYWQQRDVSNYLDLADARIRSNKAFRDPHIGEALSVLMSQAGLS